MNEKYIETAITLSRLYGIAETLHPWAYLENHRFCDENKNVDRGIFTIRTRIFYRSLNQK